MMRMIRLTTVAIIVVSEINLGENVLPVANAKYT